VDDHPAGANFSRSSLRPAAGTTPGTTPDHRLGARRHYCRYRAPVSAGDRDVNGWNSRTGRSYSNRDGLGAGSDRCTTTNSTRPAHRCLHNGPELRSGTGAGTDHPVVTRHRSRLAGHAGSLERGWTDWACSMVRVYTCRAIGAAANGTVQCTPWVQERSGSEGSTI